MACEHTLAEMETECADGTCPICARVQAIRMRSMLAVLLAEVVPIDGHGTGRHENCTICGAISAANNLLNEYGR